jgi:cell division protein FtsL
MQQLQKKRSAALFAVIRLRTVLLLLSVVAAAIAVPLYAVWRQVYITTTSIACRELNDSLSVLNREIQRQRLISERLSDNGRIETIARSSLGLEYPSSERIMIVSPAAPVRRPSIFDNEFFAILKRSITRDKS